MKKQLYLYVLLLAIIVIAMVKVKEHMAEHKEDAIRDLPQIKEQGVLRLAADYNSVELHASADSMAGFQYELAKEFSNFLGVDVEIYPIGDIQESLKGLENNEFDIVARLIPVTTSLKNDYAVSTPFITSKHVLVQRKVKDAADDSTFIRNQLKLAGKELYIPANSSVATRISNLMKEIGDTIYVKQHEIYQDEQLIQMVAAGLIDYAVVDEHIAKKMIANYPDLDIETDISFSQLNSWITRKESIELIDSINSFIDKFKTTDKFKSLQKRYLK